ncbi:MAG: hypothetical protein M3347_14395, partial [Armatimonadota bacterium]|nr:hypothetical protein [Armatimonadota bacterium]
GGASGSGSAFGGGVGSAGTGGGMGAGGAIFLHRGTLNAMNCTFTGNTAQGGTGNDNGSGFGGALFNLNGIITLDSCTLAANTVSGTGGAGGVGSAGGGAVYNLAFGNVIETGGASTASLTLRSSILADTNGGSDLINNKVNGTQTNIATVDVGGRNIVESSDLSGGTTVGALFSNADPLLYPLANNGGPTQTIALRASSPAIDTGDTTLTTDQRGVARPVDLPDSTYPNFSSGSDIGAFEVRVVDLPGTLQFSSATYSVNEGDGTATITVQRVGGQKGPIVVRATTGNGTATASTLLQSGDYTATYPSLRWEHGDTADKSFTVPILDDSRDESDETINLALLNPSGGAVLGSPNKAVLTITDNDGGKPDLLVRRESELDVAYVGDNVYQSIPADPQVKSQLTEPGVAASYRVRVQNDGTLNRSFVLKAVQSGSGFTTIYKTGTTDITAAITSSSGYTLAPLSPNLIASATIYVAVIPLRSQAPGAEHLSTINVFGDSSDTTVRDSVKMSTTVRPTADLLIKLSTETAAGFHINDEYQTVPSGGQVRVDPATPGSTLSYDVQVQNDSPSTRRFVLRGLGASGGFTVTYRNSLNNDITAAMLSNSGYTTGLLLSGGSETITVEVTPSSGTPGGSFKDVTVRAFLTATDVTPRDAVRARTTVAP